MGKGGCLDRGFCCDQNDFWKHFFAIFFGSKNQKSSTNSKFGQATWTENFAFGAPPIFAAAAGSLSEEESQTTAVGSEQEMSDGSHHSALVVGTLGCLLGG